MANYISIGSSTVSIQALRDLSLSDKLLVLTKMFGEYGIKKDEHGQIVVHTDMMHDDDGNVVALVIEPTDDEIETIEPFELEEEPTSSDVYEEELPPTLRPEQLEKAS